MPIVGISLQWEISLLALFALFALFALLHKGHRRFSPKSEDWTFLIAAAPVKESCSSPPTHPRPQLPDREPDAGFDSRNEEHLASVFAHASPSTAQAHAEPGS